MEIVLSNRLEELYEFFKHELYRPGDPLTLERLVVVPNSAIRDWLQQRLATDPEVGIAAGLHFIFEDEAFACLSLISGVSFPSQMELSFALEEDILRLIQRPIKDPIWAPLWDYLEIGFEAGCSSKTQRRLIALCDQLASLFREYGKQGGALLDKWREQPLQWQEHLWRRLFDLHPHWSYPYRHFEPPPQRGERRVYLLARSIFARFITDFSFGCPDTVLLGHFSFPPARNIGPIYDQIAKVPSFFACTKKWVFRSRNKKR